MIVIGMAIADFAVGYIKAYCTNSINSKKMRVGGMHKLCEIIVIITACGLDIGIVALGKYYDVTKLAGIAGDFTAFSVFLYIVAMEIVSILENYAIINPDAKWAQKLIKHLKLKEES
jgi:phage-related holin